MKYKLDTIPRTAKEIFMKLPEGTLAELIGNTIYILSMPDLKYHEVRNELMFSMHSHVKNLKIGSIVTAPLDIFLNENVILQPDLLFISKGNTGIIKDNLVKGAPDLIIEIISPGNRRHDTFTKKHLYEKFGVQEYFIVDPETKETITWYLTDKKYAKQTSVKGKIKSKLLKNTFSF